MPRVGTHRILFVGPSAHDAVRMRRSLSQATGRGFDVEHATTPEAALERFQGSRFDAALLDAEGSPEPPLEAFRRLQGARPELAIVLATPSGDEDIGSAAVDAGAEAWLPKDRLEDSELAARVLASAIEVRRLRMDLAEASRRKPDARAAARQREELERLKELNQQRTQLLNTAAHELSTPLTPIQLQVQLLRTEGLGPLGEEQREAMAILARNVDRLSLLVRDILDVARIESGRLKLARVRVQLETLAREAVESFEEQARVEGIDLKLDARPVEVEADGRRISQVLYNLINNALKFTPRGGRVRVEVGPQEPDAVVHVRDTGIGLKPGDFSRLFQPFSQVHDTMQRTHSGAGLGLFISQGIVEQHGGRIWCDSPGPGQGAVFSFALPLAGTGAAPGAPAPATGQPARRNVARRTGSFIFFKCPECQSRDIQMRILRNRYECHACDYAWR